MMSDEERKALEAQVKRLINVVKQLRKDNEGLQDEVDSLWMMLDEMTKSDIENWSHLLDEIKADVATRALMVCKKKADA